MINALKGLGHNQFEFARWAPQEYDRYKIIRVEIVSEDAKRWNTTIQNLITCSDSTLVKTSYIYPYEVRQHIMFRNKWWEIASVSELTTDVNSQVLSLVKNGNPQYLLELVQVNGYDVK